MKEMRALLFLNICLIGLIVLFGCKKDHNGPDNTVLLTTSAEDQITATILYEEMYSEVEEALVDVSTLKSAAIGNCKTINHLGQDSTGNYQLYEIDFGDSCIKSNNDNWLKSGKIIVKTVKADEFWSDSGLKRIISFENFKIQGYSVKGDYYLFYEGKDNTGHPFFTEMLDSGTITFTDNSKITYSFFRKKVWIDGYDKVYRLNDVFYISGTGEGHNRKGKIFYDSIPENKPLIRYCPIKCKWIESGRTYIIAANDTATIDYGNDVCDNYFSITMRNGSRNTLQMNP